MQPFLFVSEDFQQSWTRQWNAVVSCRWLFREWKTGYVSSRCMQAFFPCQEQEAPHSAFRKHTIKQTTRKNNSSNYTRKKQTKKQQRASSISYSCFPFEKRIGEKSFSSHLFCLFVRCHLVLLPFKQQQ
jgi:hypothetical protein